MLIACKGCGAAFKPRDWSSTYCTRACYRDTCNGRELTGIDRFKASLERLRSPDYVVQLLKECERLGR